MTPTTGSPLAPTMHSTPFIPANQTFSSGNLLLPTGQDVIPESDISLPGCCESLTRSLTSQTETHTTALLNKEEDISVCTIFKVNTTLKQRPVPTSRKRDSNSKQVKPIYYYTKSTKTNESSTTTVENPVNRSQNLHPVHLLLMIVNVLLRVPQAHSVKP